MDQWIALAQGPLFALAFLIMILGLARLFVLQVHALAIRKGRRIRNAPWKKILRDATTWIVPIRHFIPGTVIFSSVSFLSHIGIILVPVFLDDHIVLWESFFKVNLPSIGKGTADFLTLFTLACILVLLGYRAFGRRQRAMSQPMDYILLLMVFLPFATGYLASHPEVNPFPWNVTFLCHLLSAEALFVAIPFTKLAHIVLFMFDRISAIHWQLRPGAGDRVAHALFGNEARV
jgi:nitrate reductase gamma subunit